MPAAKILIVDDQPFNIDYLEQELEEAQYTTLSAADGREALEKVRAEPPDLILLDMMMPVMDGFEVLARLKADANTREIPVIVISASRDLGSVVKGIQLGAEDYLPKPFEPVLLHARISSCLEKKRLRDMQQLYLKSLERELSIAREIQRSFLPAELPGVAGWEIDVWFEAAREVAGDFYDAFLLPDGCLACVVGDVCGKGVGAALFMSLFRSLIRATATTDAFGGGIPVLRPDERLRHVVTFTNQYVAETHDNDNMFATLFLGIIEPQTGRMVYANCGNEPPLVLDATGKVFALPPTGPVLGVFADAVFGVAEIDLPESSLLLSFTDGIVDALNAQQEAFGMRRLIPLLNANEPPAALLRRVQQEMRQFVGPDDSFDDITVLAVRRSPPRP